MISINFVNEQMIITALCQSDCQIPNEFSTKHVHSSSEAWHHESEIVLLLPCRCIMIKAIIHPVRVALGQSIMTSLAKQFTAPQILSIA